MIRVINIGLVVIIGVVTTACTTTTTSTMGPEGASSTVADSRKDKKKSKQDALELYIKLGLGYIRENNRKGARFNLQKALAIDNRSAAAHDGLALLYQLEKENDLAEEHYRKALKYDPDFTRARNNYAAFLLRAGEYEKAHKQFLIAAKDLDYDRRSRVYVSIGVTATHLGHTEEAVSAWEKAINLDPEMSPAYFELAKAYFEANNLPRAKIYLDDYSELAGPTAQGLWLGVRIERAFGNKDGEASKGLALKKLFPYSLEYLEYREWLKKP